MNRQFVNRCLLFLATLFLSLHLFAKGLAPIGIIPVEDLPREGRQTLGLIKRGGPFPYPNDGRVFGNFEGVLPKQKRGYYHEFTVKTPGARNRGARRIVSGGDPESSGEYYYTDDHYETFRRIKE
jgi:ribonuclease T1